MKIEITSRSLKRMSPLLAWWGKLLIGSIVGYFVIYLMFDNSRYPEFIPPSRVEDGIRYVGVAEAKINPNKWSKSPYSIKTRAGRITWGCYPHTSTAVSCPTREIWDLLVGKEVEVIIAKFPSAKNYSSILLSLSRDGKEIVSFKSQSYALKNDAELQKRGLPRIFNFLGILFGLFTTMHLYSNYSLRKAPASKIFGN